MSSNEGASSERRQSSGGSGTMKFATLMQQKRNPSDDVATQRRLSHSEMQPKTGFFGNMWNTFAKGHTSPPPPSVDKGNAGAAKQSIHRTGAGTLG